VRGLRAILPPVPRRGFPRPVSMDRVFRGTKDKASEDALLSEEALHVPGQAGRIGVIEVVTMVGNELRANVKRSAERFATPAYDIATAYSNTHEAQGQFGG
jgi:hypothetical protein